MHIAWKPVEKKAACRREVVAGSLKITASKSCKIKDLFFRFILCYIPEGGLGLAFQGTAGEGEMAVHIGNGDADTFEAVVDGKVFHDITA